MLGRMTTWARQIIVKLIFVVSMTTVSRGSFRRSVCVGVRNLAINRWSGNEHSTITAAANGETFRLGVFVRNQPLRCTDEIIEDVLFVLEHSVAMPALPELAPAAQVGHGENTALFHPNRPKRVETRRFVLTGRVSEHMKHETPGCLLSMCARVAHIR